MEPLIWMILLAAFVGYIVFQLGKSHERVERDEQEQKREMIEKYGRYPFRDKEKGEVTEEERLDLIAKATKYQPQMDLRQYMNHHPDRFPGGVEIDRMAMNDWQLLRQWRRRRGMPERFEDEP